MKIRNSALPLLLLLSITACMTHEFRPAETYYQNRKEHVKDVTISYQEPLRPVQFIGVAEVRNVDDPLDPVFVDYVKYVARKRGAQGAWILLAHEKESLKKIGWRECYGPGGTRNSTTRLTGIPLCLPSEERVRTIPVILYVEP